MIRVRKLVVFCATVLAAACAAPAAAAAGQVHIQARDPLPVPDLPGYRTLKGDFHLHTVFSDGSVWPDVHVLEAWRDGLDVLSLTDHADYRPHRDDVPVLGLRSYQLARPLAESLGLILIPGAEITHLADRSDPPLGTAHFNALFVTDPDALNVPDVLEALRRARAQGAFVFWNHPGWAARQVAWFPVVARAHEAGLFHGMELVNGADFYPEAFPWIEQKRLTILANSDIHEPTPPRSVAGVRPITLLFVRTADAAGVREALEARRTAAWMGGELWGAEEWLRGLWEGAIEVETPEVRAGPAPYLRIRNRSAIPFRITVREAPGWLGFDLTTVHPQATTLVRLRIGDAPAGTTAADPELEITNLHVAPGRNLTVKVPLRVRR